MKRIFACLLSLSLIGAAQAQLSGGLMFPGPGLTVASGNVRIVNLSLPATHDDDDGASYGLRTLITATKLAAPSNGASIRITLAASSTGSFVITSAYVGQKGASSPNFDGNQSQLLFGGSGSLTISAGATVASDIISFAYDKTKDLIVSIGTTSYHVKSGGGTASGYTAYYKSSDQANAGTTTVSGYGTVSSEIYGIVKIEIFS